MKKRVISALLCCVMIFSSAVTAFAAETEAVTKEYTGKILAAINTDRREDLTFTAEVLNESDEDEETEEAEEDLAFLQGENAVLDYLSDQMVPMTYEEALQAESEEDSVSAQCLSKEYKIGDRKTIKGSLPVIAETDPSDYSIKEFMSIISDSKTVIECVYVGEYCTVWTNPRDEIKKEASIEFGNFADEMIPTELDMFGDYRIDTDKDGKIAIFAYSMGEDSGIGGYFAPYDIIDTWGKVGDVRIRGSALLKLFGNNCDCIHINIDHIDIDHLKTVFVHEYQHYIHASSEYVGKTNIDEIESSDKLVDEGFATAAQMCLSITDYYLSEYCDSVSEIEYDESSIFKWDQGEYGSYGMAFALMQYVRTRYAALTGDTKGEFPGEGIYKLILSEKTTSTRDSFEIIADVLYPVSEYPELADTDARVRQLTIDFWLAILCKEKEGVHGFNGEAWANNLSPNIEYIYDQEYTLRSGMPAFFELLEGESVKIECDNENLVVIELPTVGYKLTLDPNGGVNEKQEYELSTVYTLWDEMWVKAGCEFLGWSTDPEAEEPEYRVGDEVVIYEDTTLYAVWGPMTQLVVNNEYALEANGSRGYQFTPEVDGAYYIDSTSVIGGYVLDGNGLYVTDDLSGFGLEAGVLYDFRINLYSDTDGTFTLKKRDTYYDLRYVMEADFEWSYSYKTTYIVDVPATYNNHEEKTGFIGWSEDKDGGMTLYRPGDTITLSKDTTLYAVFALWYALSDGEEYAVPQNGETWNYVTFTPEKTASYKLEISAENDYQYQICDENDEYYCGGSENTVVNFEEGRSYFIHLNNADRVTVSFNSTSLKRSLNLRVRALGQELEWLYSIYLKGTGTATIPDYIPDTFGYEFLGWEDTETGIVYRVGDSIELNKNINLIALYDMETEVLEETNGIEDFGDLFKEMFKSLFDIEGWIKLMIEDSRLTIKRAIIYIKCYFFGII